MIKVEINILEKLLSNCKYFTLKLESEECSLSNPEKTLEVFTKNDGRIKIYLDTDEFVYLSNILKENIKWKVVKNGI